VTCLDVALPPQLPTDWFIGAGDAIVMDYVTGREGANRCAIEAKLRNEDVPWTMLDTSGAPGGELRRLSDLADVIVVSGGRRADLEARHLAAQVAAKAGRLVLAVPPSCKGFDAAGRALVAWNGSREAGEALRAAVPLLQRAASVTLIGVDRPSGGASIADAAAYLSRHGIEPEIVEEASEGKVSDTILARARAIGAAYVVLGAFGLPRTVEALLGGVTDALLHDSELPLLLAH
jgi:nucleotide-binding universal stress UspA family protein